jgi:dolichol-phosphate mannosyltransferase
LASSGQKEIADSDLSLSVIIPTFNESQNILKMLESVGENLPAGHRAEIIIVDDNSPDGTGEIAEEYARQIRKEKKLYSLEVIHRPNKMGLSSAILKGIRSSTGSIVVVMDGDFSHPPMTIPRLIDELRDNHCDIVIASRYIRGGSVAGWPFGRRVMSKGATKIAQYGLGINIKDPMSGFFAFRRQIIENIEFDALGYKMLLEVLVKTKGVKVKEIPYTFTNRKIGSSKLDASVAYDYFKAVWRLYRYGKSVRERENRASVRFLSKAGRFYSVGASGFAINYIVSFLFTNVLSNLWYIHATIIGILFSISSNFFLNKSWTFEDRDFSFKKTVTQYGLFAGFSAGGAVIQLAMVYLLVEAYHASYTLSLVLAVGCASVGNFILNKKWTFKEKIWS